VRGMDTKLRVILMSCVDRTLNSDGYVQSNGQSACVVSAHRFISFDRNLGRRRRRRSDRQVDRQPAPLSRQTATVSPSSTTQLVDCFSRRCRFASNLLMSQLAVYFLYNSCASSPDSWNWMLNLTSQRTRLAEVSKFTQLLVTYLRISI